MLRAAKEHLVESEGIGSDIAPCVFGFDESGELIGWAQMDSSARDYDDQCRRMMSVAGMMRSGWHATSIALSSEAYLWIGLDDEFPDEPLERLFAQGDKRVTECVSLVLMNEDGEELTSVNPYTQLYGRKVAWTGGEVTGEPAYGQPSTILRLIFNGLDPVPFPLGQDPQLCMLAMAERMGEQGFIAVCGFA